MKLLSYLSILLTLILIGYTAYKSGYSDGRMDSYNHFYKFQSESKNEWLLLFKRQADDFMKEDSLNSDFYFKMGKAIGERNIKSKHKNK